MLLPSDVARLVLGYLQQEKLVSTCQSFVTESPNLKEYAEHHTEDGTIPGCLLSLFGKNLTTILNEYITMKAKENQAEVPFMVSSLWKKLDLTLSQIRSMQESAAFNNNQRARTRKGINDRLRQRMLTSPLAVSGSLNPPPAIHQTSTPIVASQYILRPVNTPGALQPIASSSFVAETSAQNNNSTSISLVEVAQRKPPPAATASPVRRKQDIQRRRRAAQLSSATVASDGDVGENGDSLQAIIDNDFPQMVIENAREKILSNKSLQEKLAENINKFLGGESAAQSSKQSDGTTAEQEASIDEILGLQGGEIHMSEEAIHDILAQTELDPDFQELYDLFACVTSKAPKVSPRDSSASNSDPKNVSEKGKKHDVVERLLVVDSAGSTETAKKIDACSKGKESDNLTSQQIGKSSLEQSSPLPSTSQQPGANEKSNPEDLCPEDDHCNADLMATDGGTSSGLSGGDVLLDTQDIEMNNTSPPKEGADYGFHIADDISLPSTAVADKSIIRTGNEEPKGTEVTVTGAPFNVMLQESSKSDPVTPSETPQMENDDRTTKSSNQSPLNKPCNGETSHQLNAAESTSSAAKEQPVQNTYIAACPGPSLVEPETSTPCSSAPGTSQTVLDDNTIITLNLSAVCLPEDPEIREAVKSINEENFATIILSPLVKSQDLVTVIPAQDNAIIDLTDSPQQATPSNDGSVSVNTLPGDCAIYSISGPSNSSGENNVLQLMPATSSSFTPTGNIYINSCGPAMPPNVVMVSKSSALTQKQPSLFQTPPRPGGIYSFAQTMSPKLSQGSTIILASPVPPVLQGVMGMFPVSLVGQNSSTFTAPSHQILHVPVSKPIIPKLPLPPRAKKPEPPPRLSANAGKSLSNSAADASVLSSSFVQRLGNDTTHPDGTNAADKDVAAHRRVLFSDGKTSAKAKLGSLSSTSSKSQKADRNDSVQNVGSVSTSRSNVSKESKKAESTAPSVVKKQTASTTPPATARDQGTEKRLVAPSGGTISNKENVLQVETRAPQVDKRSNTQSENVKRPQETSRKPTSLPNILRRTPQKAPTERVCPTSPLVKQASQLLQGMQFQSPKKSSQEDLSFPPTPGSGLEDGPLDNHVDQARTPTSKRTNEDGGTPKPMFPPATPDLPTCSPASEAGSENSVNMAAHTLMILSRASLAKSGANTPLKDDTQQVKSYKGTSKKRKRDETEGFERRSHKRDHPSLSDLQKKKKVKKHHKKIADSFPAGMDVDKFLMSLHYDE